MADFGITQDGFVLKGFDAILGDAMDRARQAFDANVDLTATSALRKVLEVTAAEDAELWKRIEDLYYANFVSTAIGASLDRLGEDLGVPRPQQFATGEVRFTLFDQGKEIRAKADLDERHYSVAGHAHLASRVVSINSRESWNDCRG